LIVHGSGSSLIVMGRIGIDEKDIRTLIDNNLLESAEYWVSLWICEENLSSTELGKRYYVFGDCLLRLRKYSQAKVILLLLFNF